MSRQCSYRITHITTALNLRLFILVRKQSCDNAVKYVTKFATLMQLKAKIRVIFSHFFFNFSCSSIFMKNEIRFFCILDHLVNMLWLNIILKPGLVL